MAKHNLVWMIVFLLVGCQTATSYEKDSFNAAFNDVCLQNELNSLSMKVKAAQISGAPGIDKYDDKTDEYLGRFYTFKRGRYSSAIGLADEQCIISYEPNVGDGVDVIKANGFELHASAAGTEAETLVFTGYGDKIVMLVKTGASNLITVTTREEYIVMYEKYRKSPYKESLVIPELDQ